MRKNAWESATMKRPPMDWQKYKVGYFAHQSRNSSQPWKAEQACNNCRPFYFGQVTICDTVPVNTQVDQHAHYYSGELNVHSVEINDRHQCKGYGIPFGFVKNGDIESQ